MLQEVFEFFALHLQAGTALGGREGKNTRFTTHSRGKHSHGFQLFGSVLFGWVDKHSLSNLCVSLVFARTALCREDANHYSPVRVDYRLPRSFSNGIETLPLSCLLPSVLQPPPRAAFDLALLSAYPPTVSDEANNVH